MTNNKELANYVLDQLSDLEDVRYISMMGGYIFYYKDKIFAGITDLGLMVKITETSKAYLPDSIPTPPYSGAKPMLPATNIENRKEFQEMVEAMFDELPFPKKKKKK